MPSGPENHAPVLKKLILVAEDEASMVRLLKDNLTYEGYEVLVASDGEAAVESALRARPDLILLDIMLPKLDGLSLLRKLRKEGVRVPVIILSAKASVDAELDALKKELGTGTSATPSDAPAASSETSVAPAEPPADGAA